MNTKLNKFNTQFKRFAFVLPAIANYVICLFLSYKFCYIDVFKTTESKLFYFFMMAACFGLCLFLWLGIFKFAANFKQSPFLKRFLKFYALFCGVMLVLFVLTFPGLWCSDEFTVLAYSQRFIGYGWHHVFTEFYFIVAMFFLPWPPLIVMFQILVLGLIVAYMSTDLTFYLQNRFNTQTKWFYLLLVPFLLPASLLHNIYPMRAVLCSYLEILVIYLIWAIWAKKQKVGWKLSTLLAMFIGILVFWRGECIVYLLLLPIVLFLFTHKQFAKKTIICFFAVLVGTSAFMFVPQKLSLQKNTMDTSFFTEYNTPCLPKNVSNYDTAYKISALSYSLVKLSKVAYKQNNSKLVPEIRRFMDIEYIVENDVRPNRAFWDGQLRLNLNKDELNDLYKLYLKLCLTYPFQYIGNKVQCFAFSNGLGLHSFTMVGNPARYDEENAGFGITEYTFAPRFREKLLKFLHCGTFIEPGNTHHYFPYMIFYNSIPCFVLFLVLLIVFIKKCPKDDKNLFLVLLILSMFAKYFVTINTAPNHFFMYYLPIYMLGYFVLMYMIIYKILLRRQNGKNVETNVETKNVEQNKITTNIKNVETNNTTQKLQQNSTKTK